MKSTPLSPVLSLLSAAVSTLSCSGGADKPLGASDAAAADARAATMDGSPMTAADAGGDVLDTGAAVEATQLLDDMRGGPPLYLTDGPGTSSGWYTYSDRAVPFSAPAIFISDAGGLVPQDGVVFPPANDDAGPTYLGSLQPYRRCSGGGEVLWGVGFGMDFSDVAPDGGDVPMNDCDAGQIFDVDAAGDDSAIGLPFDASGWTGVQFWGKSFRGDMQSVSVLVNDDTTGPFGLAAGAGGCNVCLNVTQSASMTGACGDAFQVSVTFLTDWTQFRVPFVSMHPQGWSGASTSAVPHTSKLFDLQFQVGITGTAVAPFDVTVAYIELYK